MSSVTRKHRRQLSRKTTFAQATKALMDDVRREHEQHDDIAAWHAPSECHAWVAPHNPDKVLRKLGWSEKRWSREAARRGLSDKWCYANSLPYPRSSREVRSFLRSVAA